MSPRGTLQYFLLLSAVGGVMLVLVAVGRLGSAGPAALDARWLVGIAFVGSCAFGVSLAVRPNWHRRATGHAGASLRESEASTTRRVHRGHHPDCGHFDGHVLRAGDRWLCAGCTGLAAGSVVAAGLMVAHLAVPAAIMEWPALYLLVAGLALVGLRFAQAVVPARSPGVHMASDALFVVGLLLVTVGALYATGEAAFGLLAVLFAFLWMDTRIRLSQWRHARECAGCPEPCKTFVA